MRLFDLFAINTAFQPRRKSTATYLACVDGAECNMQYLGREVCAKYKGNRILGKVVNTVCIQGSRKWDVHFDDGYTLRCGENHLRELITPIQKTFVRKQIDYILVSNRWKSSVNNCRVHWAPSIHRNKFGKADHALVSCKWK